MKANTLCVLVISLLSTICHDVTGQQEWPMSGSCKEKTSWASVEKQLYPPFNHVISFLPDYIVPFESLTIFKNIMCASISDTINRFYGIDMTTKDTLWSFSIPESGGSVSISAAQNDSLVFVGGQHGIGLFCLDRYTGKERWFRPIVNLYTRDAIIDENRLYIVYDSLFCLNISTGDTVWTFPFFGQTTPAVDEFNCYVTGSYKTYAFNKLTGEMIWKCFNSNYHFGQGVVDESNFYTSSHDSLIARNKKNGEIVWVHTIHDVEFSELETSSLAIDNNIVVVSVWADADTLGQIYVLDKYSGDYKWHHTFGNEGAFSPIIANDVVYVVSWKEKKLYGFDTDTGELILEDDSYKYEATQPIVYNHMLYVVAESSVIELGNDYPSDIPTAKKQQAIMKVYPNPGKGLLTIEYALDEVSIVSLSVCSLTGEKTYLLVNQTTEPDKQRFTFDSGQFPPGIYFCEARIAGTIKQKEIIQRIKFVVIE
jgi:outer membrane protein assembly factor BamB